MTGIVDSYSFDSISFDFEDQVMSKMLPPLDPNDDPNKEAYIKADPRHRVIVCQHWLLGLCQVGNDCTYLHRFDKNKMPQCKHGKICKLKNCPLKHGEMDILECIFYKQGFCANGPMCPRRHVVKRPDECPVESTFEAGYYAPVSGGSGPATKKPKTHQPNENYKVSLCTHWLQTGTCTFDESCHFAHGEEEIHDGLIGTNQNDGVTEMEIYDPTRFRMDAPLKMPFTQQDKISYFILHSPDLRSLQISKRRERWAVPHWMRDELSNAFNSSKHVIVFFSVRALKGVYGVARIIGDIFPPVIGSPMSREFPVKWLRTIRIPMRTIGQMKVSSNNAFIGRNILDCKVDARVGLDLLYIAYRKPEWDWTSEIDAASYIPIPDNPIAESKMYTDALHPDQLFSEDWISKVSLPPSEQRRLYGDRYMNRDSNQSSYQDRRYQTNETNYYNRDHPGFVFCSNTPVVQEMLARGILAVPPEMKGITIDPGAPLFLLDMDSKLLFGVFQADSPLTENLEPTAFVNWYPPNASLKGSPLPYQLKAQVVINTNPISIFDPEYVSTMGKIHLGGELRLSDTKALTNLFAARAGLISKNTVGNKYQNSFHQTERSYRPPFPHVEIVYLDINADVGEIKKRILGYNAANIMQIIEEVGASRHQVRVRLRGINSGFFEGPGRMELQEPLHFNISVENEDLMRPVVDKVKALIASCKAEIERR